MTSRSFTKGDPFIGDDIWIRNRDIFEFRTNDLDGTGGIENERKPSKWAGIMCKYCLEE